ncbi:hypothetical protein ACYZTM_20440 [Pseudomonas sp. MDT2-39-1]
MSSVELTQIDTQLLEKGPSASGTVEAKIDHRPDFASTRVIFRRIEKDYIQIIGLMGSSRHWEFIVKDNVTLGEYDIKDPKINNVVYVQQIAHDPEFDHVFLSESGKVTITELDFPKGILKFNFDVILWQANYPGPRTQASGTVDVSGMQQTSPASRS